MSWRLVARRDALDPLRSRSLYVHVALFALVFGLLTYVSAGPDQTLARLHLQSFAVFLPLVGLLLGYKSIAGPRENGGLRVTLSFPHTRGEVLLGTVVGRVAVVTLLVTVGYLAATAAYLLQAGVPELGPLAVAWLFTVLLGAAMVALAVGVSASVRTTNRAVVGVFGLFLLLVLVWSQIPGLIRYVLNGFSAPSGASPAWAQTFLQLNPTTVYRTSVSALLAPIPIGDAVHFEPWFGVLVMLGWTVVPLAIGYWRFDNSDL